jgi:hypothetical protein
MKSFTLYRVKSSFVPNGKAAHQWYGLIGDAIAFGWLLA